MSSGFVLYEGPSQFDAGPIVCVATMNSRNRKTGPAIQTWIMRADIPPFEAMKSGAELSVCPDICPHRYGQAYSCYTCVFHAPNAVWKAWQNGAYGQIDCDDLCYGEGLIMRLGSYGDPAAVPIKAWRRVLKYPAIIGSLGYTHAWRDKQFLRFRKITMASVDSPRDWWKANRAGWRTFRCRLPEEDLLPGEIMCPASEEAGHKTTCVKCRMCRGREAPRSVSIIVHGTRKGRYMEWRETYH